MHAGVRETIIQKMRWDADGWLRTLDGGSLPTLETPAPDLLAHPGHPFPETPARNDFDSPHPDIDFQRLRTPHPEEIFSLTARPGFLRVTGCDTFGSFFTQALVTPAHFQIYRRPPLSRRPGQLLPAADGPITLKDACAPHFKRAHLNVSVTFDIMDQSLAEMKSLGLPIHVTELDVNGAISGQQGFGAGIGGNAAATDGGMIAEADKELTEAYTAVFKAFLKHKDAVKIVTFWGPNDANSWRGRARPLLFDTDIKPKPACDAVINLTKENGTITP